MERLAVQFVHVCVIVPDVELGFHWVLQSQNKVHFIVKFSHIVVNNFSIFWLCGGNIDQKANRSQQAFRLFEAHYRADML